MGNSRNAGHIGDLYKTKSTTAYTETFSKTTSRTFNNIQIGNTETL